MGFDGMTIGILYLDSGIGVIRAFQSQVHSLLSKKVSYLKFNSVMKLSWCFYMTSQKYFT